MSEPTTSIRLNSATPAPPTDRQNVVFQSDGGTPQQAITASDPVMVGDTGSGGLAGNVPAPIAGDAAANKFLHAGGLFKILPVATTLVPGAVKPDGTTITIDGSGKITAITTSSGMNYTGPWSNATSYAAGTVVTFDDLAYLCTANVSPSSGPALVQSKAVHDSTSGTFASNVTAGNLLVVFIAVQGTVAPTAPTDNLGTVYTLIAADAGTSQSLSGALYYGFAAASGSCTVTFVQPGGSNYPQIAMSEFSGALGTLDSFGSAYVTTSPINVNITTTALGILFLGAMGYNSSSVFTGVSGITISAQDNGGDCCVAGYQFTSAIGALTPGFSSTSAAQTVAIAANFPVGTQNPAQDFAHWFPLGEPSASLPSGSANEVLATPNGASGVAALRALVSADLPVATTAQLGAVKPDGSTIDVSSGVISVPVMIGDSGSGGTKGLVPAPAAGDGAAGKVLRADGTWYVPSGSLTNPMTTAGDLIVGGSSGTPTRLAAGSTSGNVLTSNGSGVAPSWQAPTGGGGGSYSFFDPDLAPSSPSALNDEFSSSTLSGIWTGVNLSSLVAHDVDTTVPDCLYMGASFGNRTLAALLQAIPSGDFTVYAKMSGLTQSTSPDAGPGLLLTDGATSGAGHQAPVYAAFVGTNPGWIGCNAWTNFNTIGSTIFGDFLCPGVKYLSLRRSGTTYSLGFSQDGKLFSWVTFAPGFTPTYFGPYVACNQSARLDASFEFFRYFPSATAQLGGVLTI